MRLWIRTVGALVALSLITAACGDSDGGSSTATTIDSDLLTGSLARAEEAPGLSPAAAPKVYATVDSYVDAFNLSVEEEERLRDEAYVSSVELRLEGETSGGLSTVDLFETNKGAKAELKYISENKQLGLPEGVKVVGEFTIPGVPTAIGFKKDKPGSTSVDVHWVQGRCLLTLAAEPLDLEQVKTGVKSIYKRTGGTCP